MQVGNADWRVMLKVNQRRTYVVIGLFLLIYLGLGFLIDILRVMSLYANADQTPITISQAFYYLTSGHAFPYATITAGAAAIIGLWITYAIYDKLMLLGTDYHEITPQSTDFAEKQLYNVVEEMKVAAGLHFMPKVYIIEADYMNAFASGYSEKSAMVAITRGLMQKLNRAELQAVMAHELSHIRHQDIKLTLTASILSNLILIVLDIMFYKIMFTGNSNGNGRNNQQQALFFLIIVLRYIMPLITILLMMYLSRTREYMADSGCVELMRDNQPLANALLKIHQDHLTHLPQQAAEYGATAHEQIRRAAYLYDPHYAGINPSHDFSVLFSTHPPLKDRLAALGVKFSEGN